MANPVIKVWLREPRKAWRNDGGPIPRGFRCLVQRRYTGKQSRLVTVNSRCETVRKGHWVVNAGGIVYVFSSSDMRRLYSRVPL